MNRRWPSCAVLIGLVAVLVPGLPGTAAGQDGFRTGMCRDADSTTAPDLSHVVSAPAEPPRLLVGPPRFPDEVRRHGYRGQVVLALVVDTLGVPVPATAAIMSSTDPVLSRWACAAARVLRFTPARHDGGPVAAQAVQPFSYTAQVIRRPER